MYEIKPETIRILSIALHELCESQVQGPEALSELARLIRKHIPKAESDHVAHVETIAAPEIKTVTPIVVLVLGGPGSGKGTLCDSIVHALGFSHISVGDLLRAEVASGSELGQQVEGIMQSGSLVPDELALDIVSSAIKKQCAAAQQSPRILLDGFPRTINQAAMFEERVGRVSKVLWLSCEDDSVLVARILARGRESGRVDDNEESVAERLKTFKTSTAPILDYYKESSQDKVVLLDAGVAPSEVFESVKLVLEHI